LYTSSNEKILCELFFFLLVELAEEKPPEVSCLSELGLEKPGIGIKGILRKEVDILAQATNAISQQNWKDTAATGLFVVLTDDLQFQFT
jgi:hypothetical protein